MPIEFRCSQCQKLLQTPDETAGKQAKCPECGTIQQIPVATAPPTDAAPNAVPGSPFAPGIPSLGPAGEPPSGSAPGGENPYQSPGDYKSAAVAWMDPTAVHVYAAERVATPSLMLIVTGASGLVLNVIGTAFNLLSLAVPNMAQPRGGGGMHMEVMLSGGFGIVGGLIGVAIGAVVILGGLKMKRLESHAWAMAGAIVAVIPCFSPCCLLGFPFGIWALVVLNDPQVRSAFRA